MNKIELGTIRKTPCDYSNKKVMGIRMSRFGSSWLNAGGRYSDRDGFLIWMMNIPFVNENGETIYISQDDAEDAYWLMNCGKMELENNARAFRGMYGIDERNYVDLPNDIAYFPE